MKRTFMVTGKFDGEMSADLLQSVIESKLNYPSEVKLEVTEASKGMTTKQAGLYLEHGEMMYEELKALCRMCQGTCVDCVTNKIIAIMESE